MLGKLEQIKGFLEVRAFGVCAFLGQVMGIATSKIRLFFIYLSFITMGSPVVIYLSLAFLLNIGRYIKERQRNTLWDF